MNEPTAALLVSASTTLPKRSLAVGIILLFTAVPAATWIAALFGTFLWPYVGLLIPHLAPITLFVLPMLAALFSATTVSKLYFTRWGAVFLGTIVLQVCLYFLTFGLFAHVYIGRI